ncbi:MAG: NAD(P)-dependent oxidoreductase, partial [Candidatus Veblenbacteria bacterium]|nr:NAD(P)-dependent oxidoreductase [Candidatus Veblenbacteria bacterium]
MKIVVLGNRGMLGTDLCRAFVPLGEVVGLDKEEVDVTDAAVVTKVIAEHKPDLVVNATGYTDVDGAEGNRELAFTLNDEAVKNIAAAASKVGARLVHFSTEYVFSGIEHDGYDEAAAPNPVNVYGQSKAVGERHVVAYERGYLVRTSWLYGKAPQRGKPRGMNFIDTVLKLAVEKPEVRVVADQFGNLTSTRDLA